MCRVVIYRYILSFSSATNINRKKKEREELEEALNARVRTADSDFYNDKGIIVFFWCMIQPFIL